MCLSKLFRIPWAVRLHVPPLKWFLQDVPYTEPAILQTIKHRNKSAREFVTQNKIEVLSSLPQKPIIPGIDMDSKIKALANKRFAISRNLCHALSICSRASVMRIVKFSHCVPNHRAKHRAETSRILSAFPYGKRLYESSNTICRKPLPSRTDNERSLNLRLGDDGRDRGKLRGNWTLERLSYDVSEQWLSIFLSSSLVRISNISLVSRYRYHLR